MNLPQAAHRSTTAPAIFGLHHPPVTGEPSLGQAAAAGPSFVHLVDGLAELVGGLHVLERLDDEPLPIEVVDLGSVEPGSQTRCGEILSSIDTFAAEQWIFGRLLDAEYRTIIARLLGRIVERSPAELQRSDPLRTAAALAWLALHGNDDLSPPHHPSAADLWHGFGVSNAAAVGRRLHRAAGFERPSASGGRFARRPAVWLPDVALLHSRTRRGLVKLRDQLVTAIEAALERRRADAPIKDAGGRISVSAHLTVPRWAVRAPDGDGRHAVVVTFGNDDDDVEVVGLSVPDAHRLVHMLQQALTTIAR